MKIKKIKNIIFTFVICLFGALAFNSIETKAAYFYNYFTYNELDYYERSNGDVMFVTGTGANGVYNVNYYEFSYQAMAMYNNCTWTPYSGAYVGDMPIGSFTCIGYDQLFFNSAQSPLHNTTYNTTFTIYTTRSVGNTEESVRSSYMKHSNGAIFNYVYEYNAEEIDQIYDDGYNFGYNAGYNTGYDIGVGTQNTLVGMIGAIFTGPVTMLQSVFNFNILGVNFAEMLLGLTTLLVVIWLVKRFI